MYFLDFDSFGFLHCHESSTLFLRESQICESHPVSGISEREPRGGWKSSRLRL